MRLSFCGFVSSLFHIIDHFKIQSLTMSQFFWVRNSRQVQFCSLVLVSLMWLQSGDAWIQNSRGLEYPGWYRHLSFFPWILSVSCVDFITSWQPQDCWTAYLAGEVFISECSCEQLEGASTFMTQPWKPHSFISVAFYWLQVNHQTIQIQGAGDIDLPSQWEEWQSHIVTLREWWIWRALQQSLENTTCHNLSSGFDKSHPQTILICSPETPYNVLPIMASD